MKNAITDCFNTKFSKIIIIYYLLFICHKTHIIMKYTCKNYKNRQDNKAFKLH